MKGKPAPKVIPLEIGKQTIKYSVKYYSEFFPGKAHERCAHLSFRLTKTQNVAQPQDQFVVWTQTPMVSVVKVNALKLASMHF
jgi:hypothetical protein